MNQLDKSKLDYEGRDGVVGDEMPGKQKILSIVLDRNGVKDISLWSQATAGWVILTIQGGLKRKPHSHVRIFAKYWPYDDTDTEFYYTLAAG